MLSAAARVGRSAAMGTRVAQNRSRQPSAALARLCSSDSGKAAGSGGGGDGDEPSDARLRSILQNIKTQMEKRSMHKSEERIALAFTCAYQGDCVQPDEDSRRVVKTISKKSYQEGVVLVKCPCERLHLIADNLGWFGEERNIEEILRARGDEVQHLSAADLVDIESDDESSRPGGSLV